jgi:hypothetical protein
VYLQPSVTVVLEIDVLSVLGTMSQKYPVFSHSFVSLVVSEEHFLMSFPPHEICYHIITITIIIASFYSRSSSSN